MKAEINTRAIHGVAYNKIEDYYYAINKKDINKCTNIVGMYKTIEGMINLVKLHNSFLNESSYKKGLQSIKRYFKNISNN